MHIIFERTVVLVDRLMFPKEFVKEACGSEGGALNLKWGNVMCPRFRTAF